MVEDYHGETYVAFLDILGFKRKVRYRVASAARILGRFYETIFRVCLRVNSHRRLSDVNIIVASDCAVIFARQDSSTNASSMEYRIDCLKTVLSFIRQVNQSLILSDSPSPILTTCSIAYGPFIYEDKKEFGSLRKNCFLGRPYLSAFQDNEELKARPGYCRLLRENLNLPSPLPTDDLFSFLKKTQKYYYFYWMLNTSNDLKNFRIDYNKARRIRGQLKYEHIIHVLQEYVGKSQGWVLNS